MKPIVGTGVLVSALALLLAAAIVARPKEAPRVETRNPKCAISPVPELRGAPGEYTDPGTSCGSEGPRWEPDPIEKESTDEQPLDAPSPTKHPMPPDAVKRLFETHKVSSGTASEIDRILSERRERARDLMFSFQGDLSDDQMQTLRLRVLQLDREVDSRIESHLAGDEREAYRRLRAPPEQN